MLHRMNSASPSFHSLLWRSKIRGVEATVKLATAAPDGVKRSSGSAVRFPTTVIVVSPAIAGPLASGRRGLAREFPAHDLGTEHGFVEAQLTVEFLDRV